MRTRVRHTTAMAAAPAAAPWWHAHTREIPDGPHYHEVYREPSGFRLLVGDLAAANDAASLDAERVTSIVNCCAASCGADAAQWFPRAGAAYAAIFTEDAFGATDPNLLAPGAPGHAQDPTAQWPAALLVLREARARGETALVHCAWGINRSVTTACTFLVAAGAFASFADALAAVKAARPQAGPHAQYVAWAEAFLASGRAARFAAP